MGKQAPNAHPPLPRIHPTAFTARFDSPCQCRSSLTSLMAKPRLRSAPRTPSPVGCCFPFFCFPVFSPAERQHPSRRPNPPTASHTPTGCRLLAVRGLTTNQSLALRERERRCPPQPQLIPVLWPYFSAVSIVNEAVARVTSVLSSLPHPQVRTCGCTS